MTAVVIIPMLFLSAIAKADFIENKGQWPAQVLYAADISGGNFLLRRIGFYIAFMTEVITPMRLK
ncbi:MAG: hypothetical protein WKF87_09150 [Chryseolinea sp.]